MEEQGWGVLAAVADKDRIEPRTRAMVRASLRDCYMTRDACILDISTRGLLAVTANPPRMGEIVELRVGRNVLMGQVRWSSARRFGMSLRERVSIAALAEGGTCDATLQRSAVRQMPRRATGARFAVDPQLFQRLGQLAVMALVAAAAAVVIMEMTAEGFSAVDDAVAGMNSPNGR